MPGFHPAMSQPYAGLRVLDVTHVIAGAYCSYLFALLGADVIRVEPPGGDLLRFREGATPHLPAPPFLAQACGKRAVELDLASEVGRSAFLALAAEADLLVENYRPGALAALGLGSEVLQACNPRLVTVSVNGYGGGPEAGGWRAYDHTIQAASGLMAATGTEASGPLRAGPQVVDYMAGMTAAFAAAAALAAREAEGRGGRVVVPMLDCALAFSGAFATAMAAGAPPPARRGNEAGSGSPLSLVAPTAEGLISIAATEAHQARPLFVALGRADLAEDARFADAAGLRRHAAELRAEVVRALAGASAEVWERRLNEAGVPAACVRRLDEALAFRRAIGPDFMVPAPGLPAAMVPGAPFLLDGQRPAPAGPPPPAGSTSPPSWRPVPYSPEEAR